MSNVRDEMEDCREYLASGGLGEVIGFTSMYADMGHEKVQNDTALMLAILELAQLGLSTQAKSSEGKDAIDG